MKANESFLSFHSRLSVQAACCNWSTEEEQSVKREFFIGRITDTDVQSTRIHKNPDHEGTLKLALQLKKCASASIEFPKILPHKKSIHTSVYLKWNRSRLFWSNLRKGADKVLPTNNTVRTERTNLRLNRVFFCGHAYSAGIRKVCPAREVECRSCQKKHHIAEMCNSTKPRVNRVE